MKTALAVDFVGKIARVDFYHPSISNFLVVSEGETVNDDDAFIITDAINSGALSMKDANKIFAEEYGSEANDVRS